MALALRIPHGRALEAEIADPVLATGMGAAVEVQAERGDLVAEPSLEMLDQAAQPPLGLGNGEVAVRLAGTADRIAPQAVRVDRKADLRQHPRGRRHVLDARDDEVLLPRQANVAAVARREIGDGDHLLARDQAQVHRCPDRARAGLVLRLRSHVIGRLVVERLEGVVGERVAEAPLDLLAHPLGAAIVDHELHPRLHARDPVAQVFPPRVEQRTDHGHRLVLADPHPEVACNARHRRQPTADEHGEPTLTVA